MTTNMYRVGDYVYFESLSPNPYQIRRIEELSKMPNGSVEVKVTCFFRRRDLPEQLITVADKYETALTLDADENVYLTAKQKHQLKHRELFFTRQMETLPATHIRGKCSVTFLNETESLLDYLNNDDSFFYFFVYDPLQKTLLADRGEIRVGSKYQAEIPPPLKGTDSRLQENLETLLWTPNHDLTDEHIDKFLVVTRSIGTFARALDCSSSIKQPSLHMTAAAASRDITLFHAMDTLHKHNYDISDAASSLVPSSGPTLCRDELEEWTAAETNLFEQAMIKYKKNFKSIRNDFLPWKSLKNIVEYYYMWKTTDRYVQQKRAKALESESKLKQVYIPNYDKPNTTSWNNNCVSEITNGKHCESCNSMKSSQWYSWGPSQMQCKLCHECWCYWKKYGGLKIPNKSVDNDEPRTPDEEQATSRKLNKCNVMGCSKEFKGKNNLIRHYNMAHACDLRPGSRRPIMKTRTSFYLSTNLLQKLSRRLCQNLANPQHVARRPFWAINIDAIKQAWQKDIVSKSMLELQKLLLLKRKKRDSIINTVSRIWSLHNHKLTSIERNKFPRLDRKSYERKANDNSFHEVSNNPLNEKLPEVGTKRKLSQETNRMDNKQYEDLPSKKIPRTNLQDDLVRPQNPLQQFNGKSRVAAVARKKVVSLTGGSDDIYFKSSIITRHLRHRYSAGVLRRAARRPWKEFIVKNVDETVVILD